ncbi:MAG: hypothetical protein ACRD2W_22770 [Acidimicrobiales bacterium]
MTEPTQEPTDEVLDEEGPGSDPGAAYRRAADAGALDDDADGADEPVPGVEDVYRSGS